MDTEKEKENQIEQEEKKEEVKEEPTPETPQNSTSEEPASVFGLSRGGDVTLNRQLVDDLTDQLKKSAAIMNSYERKMEKMRTEHKQEMESLRAKLPSTYVDPKTTIEGYFDFDGRIGKLKNEEAQKDFESACYNIESLKYLLS